MYQSFAAGYEKFSADNDYAAFADYYEEIFSKYNIKPSLVLDLGCGSGSLTDIMAKKGYDMIGVDISPEMLDMAREKNPEILYLNQDMREFELYGTVDAIYSSFDCINYITNKNDVKKIFKLVNNYLNYGGLFIFDINTVHKLKNVLGDNTFVFDKDDVYLVWQNEYYNKIATFYLDMFYKTDGKYERFYEEHYERAYEADKIKEMLKFAGLEILGVFDEFGFDKPKKNSERIFFVARRTR